MTDPIAHLIAALSRLPGIGDKTATRLTFHILREGSDLARDLAAALRDVADHVHMCSVCCNLSGDDPCPLCADPRRDDGVICVVERPQDILAIDHSGEFRGRFHVLHGALSPLDGVGPEDIRVAELLARVRASPPDEVILATNPTVEGEATGLYLAGLLRPLGIRVTRLAQGIGVGAEIEYTDSGTLARALQNRREI